MMAVIVEAVIVNHNTSVFAELAVRSLLWSARQTPVDLRVTIRDNHSDDVDLDALKAVAAQLDVAFPSTHAGRIGRRR